MEHGLTPEENVKREVREEVGLDVDVGELIGHAHFFRVDGNQVVCMLFACKAKPGRIDLTRNVDSEENILDAFWITPKDFLAIKPGELLVDTAKRAIRDYFRIA